MKFLEPTRNSKVIYTDNSLKFGKSREELSWNHCTSTPRRSETNGIAERAVRRVKQVTSAVLLKSGLDKDWWADSMECYCSLREIQDLLSDGTTPYRKAVRNNNALWSNGRISQYFCEGHIAITPIWSQKSCEACFFGYVLYAVRNLERRHYDRRHKELEEMDASEIHARRLNAKEVLTPMKGDTF